VDEDPLEPLGELGSLLKHELNGITKSALRRARPKP